jgi:glycosyltransferase involved in cell wall biosynthesis
VGYVDDHRLDALYRSYEALLFCGEEDFGIVPLEAIGRGCPVVALARGGAIETVEAGRSGMFFEETTVDAVIAAIERSRQTRWDRRAMHASAQRFGAGRFRDEITAWMGGTVG